MGQKVNPIVLRVGINRAWQSNWYAEGRYGENLQQDFLLRSLIEQKCGNFAVSRIDIERPGEILRVSLFSARPGMIVGKRGEDLERLKNLLARKLKIAPKLIVLNVKEVRRAETNASLIAQNICGQLERRLPFRRVIKKTMQNAMRFNIGGCKIMVGGRLNGAEIARSEWVREGQIPLHTIKADIDYATHQAKTVYGLIGVKVWVYRSSPELGRNRKGPSLKN